MRAGLEQSFKQGLFEKLYKLCCEVEKERGSADRCPTCGAVKTPSKVCDYFLALTIKYCKGQQGKFKLID